MGMGDDGYNLSGQMPILIRVFSLRSEDNLGFNLIFLAYHCLDNDKMFKYAKFDQNIWWVQEL